MHCKLETPVNMVTAAPDSKFSVTLNVKATMISAVVIAFRHFHKHLSDTLVAGSEHDIEPDTLRQV